MSIRGDVWWVEFDPSVGSEIRKTRPAVIISVDAANKYLERVVVVPLTSNTRRVYAGQALVSVGQITSKALADQITTSDKSRLKSRMGKLSNSDMELVEQAVRTQLGL